VLLLELQNTAQLPFTIHCAVTDPACNLNLFLEPKSQSKLVCVVRRLSYDLLYSTSEMATACREGLRQRISLWWTSTWGHRGEIELASLPAPLPLLIVSPLHIRITWRDDDSDCDERDQESRDTNPVPLVCGKFGYVIVNVENRTSSPADLSMRVQPYQSTDAGQLKVPIQSKLLWVGSLQAASRTVAPHQAMTHKVALCAIQPGRYELQVAVISEHTNDTHWATCPLTLHANLPPELPVPS